MRKIPYKRVCVEFPHGELIGIVSQKYPIEANDRYILDLHIKDGWRWADDYTGWALTNGLIFMRVQVCYDWHETTWDKIKRNITKNWIHSFK